MIPDRDYYADKHGKLTDNPAEYASQVAVRGCFLDERVARRFGIRDTLVSTDEPAARRRVTGRSEPSVRIRRAEEEKPEEADKSAASPIATGPAAEEPEPEQPISEPAEEPTVEKRPAPAKKAVAQRGARKKK